ncbi:MAG: hypothetical protein ACFFCW_02235 [Candidatus Hodarchaeota archaeon]
MIETILASMGIPTKPRTIIAIVFALIVALVCVISFGALIIVKIRNPSSEVDIFLNIFLTSLGYIVGILTGLLGLKE